MTVIEKKSGGVRVSVVLSDQHIEAGIDKPKGVWPKELVPVADFSTFYKEGFIRPLEDLGKTRRLLLLDAGSGNGAKSLPIALHLADFCEVELTLIDFKPEAITAAQRFVEQMVIPQNLKLDYKVEELKNFKPDPDCVDGVMYWNILHFLNPEEAQVSLIALSKSLKSDAVLSGVVCSPYNASAIGCGDKERLANMVEETEGGSTELPVHKRHRLYDDMYFYTEVALQRLLSESGLDMVNVQNFRNPAYPNQHDDDRYAENIRWIAKKKTS